MRKRSIINLFHYAVKYLLIALPVLLIILSLFVKNEDFIGSSEIKITHKYDTNVVHTVDDLVVGNAYHIDLTDVGVIAGSITGTSIDGVSTSIYNGFNDVNWIDAPSNPSGLNFWNDGSNLYYSTSSSQFVIDISTFTWSPITWTNAPTNFSGQNIWTDGTDYFYSSTTNHFKIDTINRVLTPITWTGLSSFNGQYVWYFDGKTIYSNGASQYVLDTTNYTATPITWTGYSGNILGSNVWNNGTNVYYSNSSNHYLLDTTNYTATSVTWTGLSNFSGQNIWTDGFNYFYSSSTTHYIFDFSNNSLSPFSLKGAYSLTGQYVWYFDGKVFYSTGAYQYQYLSSFDYFVDSLEGSFVYLSHTADFTDVSFISILPYDDNIIESAEFVNTGLFGDICIFFNNFANLPINAWYGDFLALFGVSSLVSNTALGLMLYMPLWILYIYIFDLLLDFMIFIPKFAHKSMEKLGGYDE